MLSTLVLKKIVEYSAKEHRYLSEVISLEKENEAPQNIFTVTIRQEGEGLACGVHHHGVEGTAKLRECGYSSLSGPHSPNDNDVSVLSPELVYLTQLYLADGWLVSDKIGHYRYATEEHPKRLNHEIISFQKLETVSETMQGLDCPEAGNATLDYLRELKFDFELRHQRYRPMAHTQSKNKTENIYISPLRPDTERYLICANYAHGNQAASLAVLLRLLCLSRSYFLTGAKRFSSPTLETVLFDGTEGNEGAYQYLWNMREEERRQILGVINLELGEEGDLVISPPKERGNGKLLSAIYYASKQNQVSFQKALVSPLAERFEHETIPFITIASQAGAKKQASKNSEENLQKALHLLRDILHILSFVKGDEVGELPDMSSAQQMPKMNLISLGNGKK